MTMFRQIFSTIKVTTLAIILSFGLSFVYAWTAPTATPPAGNVATPINTSTTAQTKVGGLTVGGLTLPAGGTITGGGANSTYGSLTVNGSKNGWYGLNFSGAGTVMMHPSYSGFFSAADNAWRWYVTDGGASFQPGVATASDFCTAGGKCLSAGQSRVIGTCSAGQAINTINNNGTVLCVSLTQAAPVAAPAPVITRWQSTTPSALGGTACPMNSTAILGTQCYSPGTHCRLPSCMYAGQTAGCVIYEYVCQ